MFAGQLWTQHPLLNAGTVPELIRAFGQVGAVIPGVRGTLGLGSSILFRAAIHAENMTREGGSIPGAIASVKVTVEPVSDPVPETKVSVAGLGGNVVY